MPNRPSAPRWSRLRTAGITVIAALIAASAVLVPSAAHAAPPILDPIGPQTVAEGGSLSIPLSATDAGGDPVALAVSGLPSFASFGSGTPAASVSGSIAVNPGFADAGTYSITVVASGAGFDSEVFTLTVTETNQDPVIAPIGAQSVDEGQSVVIAVSASDADGTIPLLAITGLPAFASATYDVAAGTAQITANPGFSDAGGYTLVVNAVDGAGGSAQQSVALTVNDVDRAPVLSAIGPRTVAENGTLVVQVSASDPDGDALQFLPSSLPAFAAFADNNDGTGTLTLTPGFTDAGTYDITMLVTDAFLDDTEVFTLTVTDVNRPPVLDPIGDLIVAEGTSIDVPISATDPDGDPVQFLPSALPTYATFVDNGDGTATLALAPSASDVGDVVTIRMLVTDGFLDTVEEFTVTIVDPTAPTVVVPADITLEATSAAGAVVDFTVTASDLLDGPLTPSCTPPAGSTFPVGTTTVACSATDSDGHIGSASFQVTVQDVGVPAGSTEGDGTPGGGLAMTGGSAPWAAGMLGGLLIALGGVMMATRRRPSTLRE